MSFCRITGKSRGLPKANFFPILPPISPGNARRFCRITGKSYGLASHHYIPVTLTSFSSRKKCRVAGVAATVGGRSHYPDISYGKRKHIVLLDYRYVLPVFDFDSEEQKELHDLFNSKEADSEKKFVYRVDEKRCNLVLPARLEAAVRDGDIRDVMFAKDTDQVLFRLKAGTNVTIDFHEYKENLDDLYEGEGPKEEVIVEREREQEQEKKQRKLSVSKCGRQKQLKSMTKIFENKDDEAEEAELKAAAKKKKTSTAKTMKNVQKCVTKKEVQKMKLLMENIAEGDSKKLTDLVKPILESWDWNQYEAEVQAIKKNPNNVKSAVTKDMTKPIKVKPAKVVVKSRAAEIVKEQLKNTIGFECTPFVGQLKKPEMKAPVKDLKQLQSASKEMMKKLENVVEKFQKADLSVSMLLPSEDEIFDVLQNISKGHKSELNGVTGCQIDIDDRRVFLAGEFVLNEKGEEVFVPGQVIVDAKTGVPTFTAGLAIFDAVHQGVNFISGMVMTSKDSQVHFQAGQVVNNEFVSGQTVYVNDEPKFIEGETILTPEGFRFVAGVYDEEKNFTTGKFLTMPNGEEKFIAGQMSEIFVSGQSVMDEKGEWKFVSGQTIVDESTGEETFVQGITIQTEEGSKFIAGMHNEEGKFVPGIVKSVGKDEKGAEKLQFVPGMTIETKQGLQFCEGQMVQSEHGEIFIAGKTEYRDNGETEFLVAESIEEIKFQKPPPTGVVINPNSLEISEPSMAVYGNMVQTPMGIEFYPEKISEDQLPFGKMIPGKLVKKGDEIIAWENCLQLETNWDEKQYYLGNETKFIPGIKTEEGGFTPGQVVTTPHGEEFVCGQIVETATGPKVQQTSFLFTWEITAKFDRKTTLFLYL